MFDIIQISLECRRFVNKKFTVKWACVCVWLLYKTVSHQIDSTDLLFTVFYFSCFYTLVVCSVLFQRQKVYFLQIWMKNASNSFVKFRWHHSINEFEMKSQKQLKAGRCAASHADSRKWSALNETFKFRKKNFGKESSNERGKSWWCLMRDSC